MHRQIQQPRGVQISRAPPRWSTDSFGQEGKAEGCSKLARTLNISGSTGREGRLRTEGPREELQGLWEKKSCDAKGGFLGTIF